MGAAGAGPPELTALRSWRIALALEIKAIQLNSSSDSRLHQPASRL